MQRQSILLILTILALASLLTLNASFSAGAAFQTDDPSPPASPVKLIFIHHSTGGNWLADPNGAQPYGGLGRALMDNNYYVSATNYGWGPYGVGDRTDIPNWPEWFTGSHRDEIMAALYAETGQNFGGYGDWPRLASDPGGENQIVIFKSCFPNSDLDGNPGDPPLPAPNDEYSVANAKAVYNDILTYFASRQDKLFVVITAPPLASWETDASHAANARAFNDWLIHDWLDGYGHDNVAVFDYYNVLTSNGGNVNTNDLGQASGNHHRWWNEAIQHSQSVANNYSAYPTGDSHPSTAGHQKAAAEFVLLLNVFYNRWQSGGGPATSTPTPTPTRTTTSTATPTLPAGPAQPSGLASFHRSGQTFLTWNEVPSLRGESYHIYRHTAPITAGNLASAVQLTADWGPLAEGSSIFQTERDRSDGSAYPGLDNYVISDLGPQLSDSTGLFVWTSGQAGDFYYAVTTVSDGVENRSSFSAANALSNPVTEAVADPQPVLVWQSPSGRGRVYTQFLDLNSYNPTFDAAGPGAYAYAYNYAVLQPDPTNCPGGIVPDELPLYLYLQGWGGRYEVEDASPYWCAIALNGDDPRQSWYFGHSASYDYRQESAFADSGPIVNYTEERLLRAIYDTLRSPDYTIDPQRIYVYGHSMGGSGSLALGMRYPNLFAASYSSEPMTNYAASGDGGGMNWREDTEWKWGSVAANLPIENRGRYAGHLTAYNGTGVWDWQNHQAQLAIRRGDEMAHIGLAHGTLDDVIEWTTQGRPAYAPFYESGQAFSGETVAADHTWLGWAGLAPNLADVDYAGPFHNFQAVRDETLPGLSHASASSPLPPAGAGAAYNMNLEWSASWNLWDGPPLDTSEQWRISLRSLSGAGQIVDVTPRRVQAFPITPGSSYNWENRRVSDNGLVGSGTVVADVDGLVTVKDFAVSTGGNRLVLQAAGGPVNTATPTTTTSATATATPTPTATQTPRPAASRYRFQDGVSPDAGYDGTRDAPLANDANANANLGGVDQLEVFFGQAEHRRTLLYWDLSSLPAGSRVISATAQLYRYDGAADNPLTMALYRVTRGWTEGTGWDYWPDPGYLPDGATWSLAAPGRSWTTPGGDYDTITDYGQGANGILDQLTLPVSQGNGWISLDATGAVRAWIEEGAENHGLLLRPSSGQYTYHYFHSREHGVASLRPRLIVSLGAACQEDVTGDGRIDIVDVQMVASFWMTSAGNPRFNPDYDFNGDDIIDSQDLKVVIGRWGLACDEEPPLPTATATATATPTPTVTPTPTNPSGSGQRPWPDTSRGIHIFNDQLIGNMSDAQVRFAASHYAGAQKMTRDQADRLRATNADFLILHYRLGHGLGYRTVEAGCQPSGPWLAIIVGNDWVQEWPGDAHVPESWLYHWPESSATRVLNCDWGWYLMAIDNQDYRNWWAGQVLDQLQTNDNDGLFMDSLSVPNYLGNDRYDPVLPAVDAAFEAAWATRIADWLAWLQDQGLGDYYLVPNVGNWITSRETTDYSAADGLMIEGFAIEYDASPYALADWQLQMNRILAAVAQGQAILGQNYATGDQERMFALGSYLLIKGNRTYLNIDLGLEPEWWPEYDIPIGAAVESAGGNIADLYDAANRIYRRDFDNGFVLVNPTNPWDGSGETRTVNLGGTFYLAQPSGGGEVSAGGLPGGSLSYAAVSSLILPPTSAAVLLNAHPTIDMATRSVYDTR